MSKLTVNFKNLCALFTKKLNNELMVGLLDLTDFYGVPKQDIHFPKIIIETEKKVINPNGEVVSVPQVWMYAGFSKSHENCSHDEDTHAAHLPVATAEPLSGKIILEVHGVEAGLSQELTEDKIADLTQQITARKRKAGEIKKDQEVIINTFDSVLDLQNRLHENGSVHEVLTVVPELCKAKFHFQHGLLYGISLPPFAPVEFKPPNPDADGEYPLETGLEISLPEDGYAILRFLNSDTKDYIFQGAADQHYFVTIENSPLEHHFEGDPNHFKYYYKLVTSSHTTYLPIDPSPTVGSPFCMIGGFGDADY